MEAICTCSFDYGEWSRDTETLTKARGFLHQLVSFEFLVTFNVTMRVLSSLRSLTVKLQKKSNDILAAYERACVRSHYRSGTAEDQLRRGVSPVVL